jgi:hypothetical protein
MGADWARGKTVLVEERQVNRSSVDDRFDEGNQASRFFDQEGSLQAGENLPLELSRRWVHSPGVLAGVLQPVPPARKLR